MRRWYELVESLKIAIAAIRANTARGVLTTLGIIIGVMGVITTMTAVNGLANNFKESVSVLGTDVVYVSRMPWIIRGNFFEFRNRPNVTLKDARELEHGLRGGAVVNPSVHTQRSIKYASRTLDDIDVIGTTEKQMQVSASVPELGRFLTAFDTLASKPVAVVGADIRTRLFEGIDPLNKEMKIGRTTFRVVGVMEKQGSAGFFGGPNFDSQIFVPITAFTKSFGGSERDINVAVKAPPAMALDEFEYEVIGEMRKIRKLTPGEKDDFSLNKMDSLVAVFNNVMGVVL
ncbi:MAG TPA: ABC transporter permease, partial [Thermoanaerobaculia bacterium]|nr:ABC transporter permease [Thermoanaerobaculia bacterium]